MINKNNINNKNEKIETIGLDKTTSEQKESSNDFNELPLSKAKILDKRNIFQIFISILFNKLELVDLFINKERIRVICICEYILSLLLGFFFNTLLYSDDVVSHKYHNNG